MITPQQVQNIYQSWKSTLTGICGFAIVIIIAYTTLPPKAGHTVTALAVLRAVVDFIKKDAGVVQAIPAGGTKPEAMASTEIPLEPGATVVNSTKE